MKFLKNNFVHLLVLTMFSLFPFSLVFGQDGVISNPLGNGANSLGALFSAIVDVFIQLGAVVAALAIMYGGFLYVTAQGSEEKLQKAQATVTWALVGAALLLGSRTIFNVIDATIREISN